MGGGLMSLVAYGAQDVYITGNPQITFFKVVYRRHTNFAVESIQQTFNQTADFGNRVSTTISRNGDLIHRMLLEIHLPTVEVLAANNLANPGAAPGPQAWTRWVNYLGHALIKYTEIEIGGQTIDKQYGEWLHIWNQLTMEAGQESGYHRMVGNLPELILPRVGWNMNPSGVKNDGAGGGEIPERILQIPLQFWFCRNPGLALPLIALQYHEVKINVQFRSLDKCLLYYKCDGTVAGDCCNDACNLIGPLPQASATTPDLKNTRLREVNLYVDYIFLDTDERRRFAQLSHEYLIEQVQHTETYVPINTCNTKIDLPFNHPVKELIWVAQKDEVKELRQHFNYTTNVTPFFYAGNNDANRFIGEAVAERLVVGRDSYSGLAWDGDLGLEGGAGPWETTFNMPFDSDTQKDAAYNDPFVISMDHSYIPENLCKKSQLKFNGQNRFCERIGDYFNYTQPYYHHTRTPATGINVYSFALRPEEHQPSGSCNFSRLDGAHLHLHLHKNSFDNHNFRIVNGTFIKNHPECTGNPGTPNSPVKVSIYAVNYNVLRIMSGMGGLAYSN